MRTTGGIHSSRSPNPFVFGWWRTDAVSTPTPPTPTTAPSPASPSSVGFEETLRGVQLYQIGAELRELFSSAVVIKDVQVVPRFIGEWGDVIITLKDGTIVDLRSVPKFREIAKYCLSMAEKPAVLKETGPK
ncbi:hypothetical protein Tsubulata_020379, partial [Turnera subulata]